MSTPTSSTIHLDAQFAEALPEMAVPTAAEVPAKAQLVAVNDALAAELGLDADWLRSDDGTAFLTGQDTAAGTFVAQAYSGHQFGNFNPHLGDGRALLLGELRNRAGRLRDIGLKGSGRTRFSRMGDGRAVLGPMLREYLISEAMAALGVPTTRSLAVIATGHGVRRETIQPGAMLVRVASSHLRVGSFQYARVAGDDDLLRRLADHAIARHHPDAADAENPYLALLDAVISAQASLVAQWMNVGFIHGVMNTDNMTISGETIDYGPCAFMDHFDPATVFSSIDAQRRYAYGNQPQIAHWNLVRFAETLLPLLTDTPERGIELAEASLRRFPDLYTDAWRAGLAAKLGLSAGSASAGSADGVPPELLGDLMDLLTSHALDFTTFFRALARVTSDDRTPVTSLVSEPEALDAWLTRWLDLSPDRELMDRTNPVYIPRNHLVEEALDAATGGDLAPFGTLLDAVTSPFTERAGFERYAQPAPEDFGPYTTYCGT
ncbi:MAG TPA: YdiU family protein [Dietzia timorensis]|uniref:Protein nucleotidyltransferase YdiU n=1 Tax=Dietzia timorensis TaxID=499555 RepID=A0A921JYW5_9ACTN|nr:YdiU family protein [Dietzia timorensis]HJE91609.1 YdiU family protein [Dietzia timorensis]